MQVQDLRKPRHSRILCSLHAILLLGVAGVASYRKAMGQTGEVLVIVLDVQGRNRTVSVRFQLGRELLVVLRRHYLYRYAYGVDFLFLKKRRMGGGDAVDKVIR